MLQLEGKTALVFGVASEDSIAWAICNRLAEAGCKLILGYQKRFMSRVLAFYPIDVAEEGTTAEFFQEWQKVSPGAKADVIIHAIGFAPRECFDRHMLFVEDEPINSTSSCS